MGVTGRRIVEALIAGEDSPEILSWKVRGKLRSKEKLVKESLKGCFNDFHRTMLASHYKLYHRIKSRRGWAKAIVATGHKILTIAFQMLCSNTLYKELGDDYFRKLNPARTTRRLVQQLEALGHVVLSPTLRSNA